MRSGESVIYVVDDEMKRSGREGRKRERGKER